jgi:hypothetical protein
MPNWCFNTLTIQGPKEQVDSIKKRLNTPFQKDYDNWNPKTQQMEIKTALYPNPVFAFHNIYNHIEAGISDEDYMKQPDYSLPMAEQMQFRGSHWYDFNVREWGAKWDVGVSHDDEYPDTELLEHISKGEDQWLVYKFNTAWSPPAPAIEKLSKLVPNCVVTLSFEEETGWGGELEFVNGEMTADSNYESMCRDCEATDCMEYCDNDCGQICSECNYLGEADLDCVKECQTHKVYLDDEHVPDYRKVEING